MSRRSVRLFGRTVLVDDLALIGGLSMVVVALVVTAVVVVTTGGAS